MRIVAGFLPDQIGDDNRLALGRACGPEQLLHPRVVINTVVDDDARGRDIPADRRTHLEQMRVLVGVAEDAGHLHVRTADLLGDVAVEVLGGDDADRLTHHLRQNRRCEQDCECGQGRELFHPDPPVRHGLDGA